MSKRRVVVTGLGAVTPIGNDVETFWKNVKAGKMGISEITKFDTTEFKVKLAAEVKDFNAKEHMDFKSARRMELFSQYAVAAAKEAMTDAEINMENEDPFRVGVIVGSGIGSLQAIETATKRLVEKGPAKVDPLFVPKMISNMAAGNVSIATGARGKCTNVVTACAQELIASETLIVRSSMEMQKLCLQEVQKGQLRRSVLLVLPTLQHLAQARIPAVLLFLLIKKEEDLS